MLSTIVIVPADTVGKKHPYGPLLRTLAALVPPTVDGTIRDVTLLRVGESADAANIADEAGCRIVQADGFGTAMSRCVAGARASWILILRAGAAPGIAFGEDVASAFEEFGDAMQALLLRQVGSGLGRVVPGLAPVAGVIASRARLEGRGFKDFADVVRRIRPARTLRTRLAVLS